jgi:tRNA pseudouridine38-40 synthase
MSRRQAAIANLSNVSSNASAEEFQRVALVIQYLGTHFHGWQRQPNHRTVQEEIEQVLTTVLGHSVTLHGAGRTDSGVHAAAQVAHFDAPALVPAHRWAEILNHRLPKDVMIRGSAAVSQKWHARFSASWRRYRYTIYNDVCPNLFLRAISWHYYHERLNDLLMQAALVPLIGRHHLAAFHRAGSSRAHSWVEIHAAECVRRDMLVEIELQASGFLYGMVRLLVGLLIDVGKAVRSPDEFTSIWKEQRRDQVKYAAPPQGLCLLRVGYPDFPFSPDVWYDTQPRFFFTSHAPPEFCRS